MLRVHRQLFNKTTFRSIRRGLNTSCHTPHPASEKPTKRSSYPWSTSFLSNNKEDEKNNQDNEFIGKLFDNKAWLTEKMNWWGGEMPSIEDINTKLTELYPQFNDLKDNYEKVWDYLTMEDFRKVIEEIQRDAKDVNKFPELAKHASVREGSSLSRAEQDFIDKRKQLQKASFAQLIGVDTSAIDERDIPVVGIASSGGGYRAMIGLTGYLKAMKETGALDSVMYFAGVSGSCWTQALYYNQLTHADPHQLATHLKSHVNTHWANTSNFISLLTASPENSKLLLQGAIQRFTQQKGDFTLVDLFGVLMGQTLLSKKRDMLPSEKQGQDTSSVVEEATHVGEFEPHDMYLSGQAQFLKDGSQPLPIYSVVRHDITVGKSFEERIAELKKKHGSEKQQEIKELEEQKKDLEEKGKDAYQWFEFTPYEMGCEELEAWVPMWAFGRKFEKGQDTEPLPEQTLDILMGMFGSAFAASLVHFYKEIKSFLPRGALSQIDDTITRYEASMSSYHPISPSSFANPFYQISDTFTLDNGKQVKRPEALIHSKSLYLMDAGMDNNIPFYPLLREGRNVDVIIAFDLSADIQTTTHFDRAESYIKRRGIEGWPSDVKWPEKKDNSEDKYPLGSCTVFDTKAKEEVTTLAEKSVASRYPVTLAYFPFIVNKAYDPEFDPQEEDCCKTWNFIYTPEQVDKVIGLAEANWNDNLDKIKHILRRAWERKRDARLNTEKK